MKKLSTTLWKIYDLLRGHLDSTTSLQVIKTLTFLYLLEKELLKKNEAFTSQLQGSFDFEGAKTNEELLKSLRSFISQNEALDWLDDSVSELVRLTDQNLFEKVMSAIKNIPVETSTVEVYLQCVELLATRDRFSSATPSSLCQLAKELLAHTSYDNLYDPAIGTGKLAYEVSMNHENVKIYGQDIHPTELNSCRMLLTLSGRIHELSYLKEGHTITAPKHLEGNKLKRFDCVVSQPPFGLRDWGIEQILEDDDRFHRGLPPRVHGDYAFITQVVESLNESGKALMILPSSPLFREAREGEIRKQLIQENLVETVISLPGNMLHGTAIPVNIVIFNKQKSNNDIFFINAISFVNRQRTQSTLTESAIKELANLYHTREEVEEISRIISLDEVKANRYNLMVERYVTQKQVQEVFDLEALQQEHQDLMKHLETIQTKLKDILA